MVLHMQVYLSSRSLRLVLSLLLLWNFIKILINVIIHGVMTISYFSQFFIHGEFKISLLPLESGNIVYCLLKVALSLLIKIQVRMALYC